MTHGHERIWGVRRKEGSGVIMNDFGVKVEMNNNDVNLLREPL